MKFLVLTLIFLNSFSYGSEKFIHIDCRNDNGDSIEVKKFLRKEGIFDVQYRYKGKPSGRFVRIKEERNQFNHDLLLSGDLISRRNGELVMVTDIAIDKERGEVLLINYKGNSTEVIDEVLFPHCERLLTAF